MVNRKEELKKARHQNEQELSQVLHCNRRFILLQNKVSSKQQNLLGHRKKLPQ